MVQVPIREYGDLSSSDCPILITPENNEMDIVYGRLFDWWNYPNATYYRIQISLDSLFNTVNIDNNTYNSQFNLFYNMQQNRYYFWRVNARYNSTFNSFWSEIRRFKTSATYTGINKLKEILRNTNYTIIIQTPLIRLQT